MQRPLSVVFQNGWRFQRNVHVSRGKLCRSPSLQSLANPQCSKTAGPVYSAGLPFVSARAAAVTPGTTGRQRFLMSHFYSGDKVSYPRRLKRPRGALEWQPWDARQTHRDTLATERGGGGGEEGVNTNYNKNQKNRSGEGGEKQH